MLIMAQNASSASPTRKSRGTKRGAKVTHETAAQKPVKQKKAIRKKHGVLALLGALLIASGIMAFLINADSQPKDAAFAEPPAAPSGKVWSLKWSDEFNGTSVDTSKWNVADNSNYGSSNKEDECYKAANTTVSGGALHLTAKRQTVTCGGTNPDTGNSTYYFTSGMVTTRAQGGSMKYKFKQGYAEARVKSPRGNPYWSAFWLVSPNDGSTPGWPTYGEFDIFELYGARPDITTGTLHYACTKSGGHCQTSPNWYNIKTDSAYGGSSTLGTQLSTQSAVNAYTGGTADYQVYGFLWEADKISWYVNGRKFRYFDGTNVYRIEQNGSQTLENSISSLGTPSTPFSTVFGYDHSIILNLAFGGNGPRYSYYGYTGSDSASGYSNGNLAADLPGNMDVDYVRVYQLETGSSSGSGSTSGSGGTSTGGTSSSSEVSQTGNLVKGKTFTSSVGNSTKEPGHPTSYITDANGSTRWISLPTSPVNLTVDLGSTYALNKMSVKWAGDTIRNFQFQISNNNSTWTTFYTGATNNTTSQYADYTSFSAAATGRYLRIVGTDRWKDTYGNSIWEVGAYGTAATLADTTAPTVALTTPAAGAALTGTTTVSGSAADNIAVTKVELLVDGVVKATNSNSSTSFSWNTTSVADGSHSISLRASDAAGNSTTTAARSITVRNATPVPAPTISSFTASPSSVSTGNTSTLSWVSSNASGCSITPSGPTNTTAASWQTAALTTTGTRTYTLTCTNTSGSATKTVNVTVTSPATPPAKPTFTASATTISSGSSVTLSWSSSGAASCSLNPGGLTVGATASKVYTNVTASTTYSLSCQNSAGTTSADPLTVKVTTASVPAADPTIASFTASPATLTSGQPTTLTWITSNVTTSGCNLSPSPLVTAAASGNWKTPALTTSTSYTLTCVNGDGKQTSKSVAIIVNGQPAPAAPAATSPAVNKTDTTANKVTASTGQTVSNAAATETVTGPTTLDPSNITNSAKEQSILRVEYYDGELLIQTDTEKPFVLDSTKLKNGRYTLTERTYFIDGSQSETSRVVTIANSTVAAKHNGIDWIWLILLLPLLSGGGLLLYKRKRAKDAQFNYPMNTQMYYPLTPYGLPTPDNPEEGVVHVYSDKR